MKKLAFSVFAATLSFGAIAEPDTPADAATDAAVEADVPYNGFYAGIGVNASEVGVKAETTASNIARDIGVDNQDHATRFGGSLVLGFGKKIKSCGYVGVEAGLDAGRARQFNHQNASANGRVYEVNTRINGLVPSLALIGGYIDCGTKILTYIKAGVAYSKVHASYEDNDTVVTRLDSTHAFTYNRSVSKLAPIVALGLTKPFSPKMTARLEAEYRFATRSTVDFQSPHEATYKGTVKVHNRDAVTLRALFVYNVKLGF